MMSDNRKVVVQDSSAGSSVAVMTILGIVVAVGLIALIYLHPWNTMSTSSTTTVTQPANGDQQKSTSTTTTNTQPQPQAT